MTLIDTTYLENHVGGSTTLLGYAKGVATNITNAIAAFHGKFKSDALRAGYTEESIDALTVATAPEFWKAVGAQWSLGQMTSGDGGRPLNIDEGWNYANEQLKLLATDNHTIDELTKATTSTGTGLVRIGAPTENVFDRENVSQRYNLRDPQL